MRARLPIAAIGGVVVVLIAPTAARADQGSFSLGARARSLGMGGARVAVDDPSADATYNPALLAGHRGFHFGVPSFNLDAFEGPSLSDINSKLNDISKAGSGSNNSNYKSLGQVFANRTGTSTVSASAFESLGYGGFAVTPLVEGTLNGTQYFGPVPNSVSVGNPAGVVGIPSPVGPAGTSTVYKVAGGYAAGAGFAYGARVPLPANVRSRLGSLQAGINLKLLTGKAFQRYVQVTRDAAGNVTNGSRADNTVDPGTTSSVGVDLGFLVKPMQKWNFGLAIQDAVPASIPGLNFQTTVTAGASYQLNRKVLLAADLANLTGAYGQSVDFRAGVEATPIRHIALRGGVSNQGLALGIGVYGLDFAYSFQNQKIAADILHLKF